MLKRELNELISGLYRLLKKIKTKPKLIDSLSMFIKKKKKSCSHFLYGLEYDSVQSFQIELKKVSSYKHINIIIKRRKEKKKGLVCYHSCSPNRTPTFSKLN